ncbi:hypothetical protein ACFWVM_14820 [Nocardia fluminea]|uniref:hypothetical protein n=1 Tax=Nocardia fluminea TaxID=134984 RepID=UPI003667A9FA
MRIPGLVVAHRRISRRAGKSTYLDRVLIPAVRHFAVAIVYAHGLLRTGTAVTDPTKVRD